MKKGILMDFVEEDKKMEASKSEAAKAPASVPDVPEAKKTLGRGRPKSKPDSKLASFHLPLDLIAKIDSEALKVTAGNKSLFLIGVLEKYFAPKE